MPEINRRRLILGLAAASTAAAAVTIDASAAPTENPKLIALAAELPAISEAYHTARQASDEVEAYWKGQVWAPDELTVPGIANPWDGSVPKQPGRPECTVLGSYLWRKGDKYVRRIVVTGWEVHCDLVSARRKLRKARKDGRLADGLILEEEVARLKKLERVAYDYEREFRNTSAAARADHERYWRPASERLEELEQHVAAIMNEPDNTMEGLIIKAQALAEWDRVRGFEKVAFRHGTNWHGQIAASILRHAGAAA